MASDRIQFGHYRIVRTIGHGASAKVKLAVNEESGEEVALKIYRRTMLNYFGVEESAVKQLSHRNVIRLIDSVPKAIYLPRGQPPREVAFIELEYCSRGELINFIFSLGAFPEPVVKRCAVELLQGLAHIHSHSLAHRDLKPENILVSHNFEIKIADFGFAKEVGDAGEILCSTYRGTKGYFAPEVLNRETYNGQKSDIFSMGVILYTLFTARPPFTQAISSDRFYSFVEHERWPEFWARNQRIAGTPPFSEGLKAVMEGMLCRNPAQRMNCSDLLAHPWLTSGVCDPEELRSWLSRGVPSHIAVATGDDTDSHYRALPLSRFSSLGSWESQDSSDELSLFRYSSRVSLPATLTQTAFAINLPPECVYLAVGNWVEQRGGRVVRHEKCYKLQAQTSDGQEFECRLCDEEGTVKVEFMRRSGEHFAFFSLIKALIEDFSRE